MNFYLFIFFFVSIVFFEFFCIYIYIYNESFDLLLTSFNVGT
jgi:hypothetical protein